MTTRKHLTLTERRCIEYMLGKGYSFKAMGRDLKRDPTTIREEIKGHVQVKRTGAFTHPFNDCAKKDTCNSSRHCSYFMPAEELIKSGIQRCALYEKKSCELLDKAPYACNGCEKKKKCTLEKHIYSARFAQDEYEHILSEARVGVNLTEKELSAINQLVSPALKKGHSVHHIYTTHPGELMFVEKTLYNYIGNGLLSAGNIDCPRRVRFKYKKKNSKSKFKVEKNCRQGRTYQDYIEYIAAHPDTPIVQGDTVEGVKGGAVMLTLHFVTPKLQLAFKRDRNTAASVVDIINYLDETLGRETFMKLFPVLLVDNGSEFSSPSAIEQDEKKNTRTRVFYCDPSMPSQKGAAENNHEFIRRVIPKGKPLDGITQEKINLMMNHINSYHRGNLGDRTPYDVFSWFYGEDVLKALGVVLIPPDDIVLRPKLLK